MNQTSLYAIEDQTGQEIALEQYPQRIVSLVPSITELLAHLKLDDEVVGITKFCIEPKSWFRNKQRIGGTKTPKLDKIEKLRPDLIFANKEENIKEHIESLKQFTKVYVSDIATLEDALVMILQVGMLTNRVTAAGKLVAGIQAKADKHAKRLEGEPMRRAAYFIWRKPWMVAGGDTFINSMMQQAGFENVFAAQPRYPEQTKKSLQKYKPDVVLLSSEPYPFKKKHISEMQAVLPDADIQLVDGSYFSWYGSRLSGAFKYFKRNSFI